MTFQVVPWFNSEEWKNIYHQLLLSESDLSNKIQCLSGMKLWKARAPFLVSGIESTMTLLEVSIQEKEHQQLSDQMLRLAYASALLRFVNHTVDSDNKKSLNFYNAAKSKNIPDWIVNLRHDIAHNNSLPSLEILKLATEFALDWLKTNYWEKHSKVISDYFITDDSNSEDIVENCDLEKYISFYISLCLCAHSRLKIKSISHIRDRQMREDLLYDAENLFGDKMNFLYKKNVFISNLMDLTESKILEKLEEIDSHKEIINIILGSESLFLSEELLLLISQENLHNVTKLPKQYIYLFEALLKFLHTNGIIMDFIEELIKITMNSEKCKPVRKLAALWLSEIFGALQKSSEFLRRVKINNIGKMSNKELRQLLNCWFPKFGLHLMLDVWKQPPSQLLDISYIQKIITAYNPYLTYFIKELLHLVKPPLNKTTVEHLSKLASLISENHSWSCSVNSVDCKVFTIDDVKTEGYNYFETSDSDCVMLEVEDETSGNEESFEGIWQRAPATYDWTSQPLGLLPWQTLELC